MRKSRTKQMRGHIFQIKTSRGMQAQSGREPSRNRTGRRRSCTCRIFLSDPRERHHAMILKATRNGVSEQWIARVLKVDVASIRQKRDLLNCICKEAAEIRKNKQVSRGAFVFLRTMKPMRQIGVAELLTATGNFSVPYVKALFAATHPDMLVEPRQAQGRRGSHPGAARKDGKGNGGAPTRPQDCRGFARKPSP